MLRADESPGRCSKTMSETFAAARSSPNETIGSLRSARIKHSVADVICSSLVAIVGTRGSVVFTVARWAHPHDAKIDNAKTILFHDFIVRSAIRFDRARARYIGKQIR